MTNQNIVRMSVCRIALYHFLQFQSRESSMQILMQFELFKLHINIKINSQTKSNGIDVFTMKRASFALWELENRRQNSNYSVLVREKKPIACNFYRLMLIFQWNADPIFDYKCICGKCFQNWFHTNEIEWCFVWICNTN